MLLFYTFVYFRFERCIIIATAIHILLPLFGNVCCVHHFECNFNLVGNAIVIVALLMHVERNHVSDLYELNFAKRVLEKQELL